MAGNLTTKEEVFFFIVMLELGFDSNFGSVPLYIDNTSAPHVTVTVSTVHAQSPSRWGTFSYKSWPRRARSTSSKDRGSAGGFGHQPF